jgi:hypothetical protein
MMSEADPTRSKKTTRAKPQKGRSEKVKCSLLLRPDNDLRLTVLAAVKGMDRSELLNPILDDALRGVVVSLRGQLADDGAGEEEPEAA